MVQVVMGFLDVAPSADTKLQTIETLRTVTEGKVSLLKMSERAPRNMLMCVSDLC